MFGTDKSYGAYDAQHHVTMVDFIVSEGKIPQKEPIYTPFPHLTDGMYDSYAPGGHILGAVFNIVTDLPLHLGTHFFIALISTFLVFGMYQFFRAI